MLWIVDWTVGHAGIRAAMESPRTKGRFPEEPSSVNFLASQDAKQGRARKVSGIKA